MEKLSRWPPFLILKNERAHYCASFLRKHGIQFWVRFYVKSKICQKCSFLHRNILQKQKMLPVIRWLQVIYFSNVSSAKSKSVTPIFYFRNGLCMYQTSIILNLIENFDNFSHEVNTLKGFHTDGRWGNVMLLKRVSHWWQMRECDVAEKGFTLMANEVM